LSRFKLMLYHMAKTVWYGSGSVMCHYWMWKFSSQSLYCYFVSI